MKKSLAALAAIAMGSLALSQTYVYDDFSAVGSGTGFVAGSLWDDGIVLTSASPLHPLAGQYAEIGEFGESFRQLSAGAQASIDARTAGGNSIWVGFLARWTGPTGAGAENYGGVQLRVGGPGTGSAAKRFFMGSIWEKNNWGAGTKFDSLDVESSAPIGPNADFLSYELNLSTQVASMYVNNNLVLSNLELNSGANLFSTLSWLKIEAGSGSAQKIGIDELRIGATAADVQAVPEPATMAVLGLGALALFRRRR